MKPIKFKESNITLVKDQPQYQQLPIYKDKEDKEGKVTSCWKLSWLERIKLFFTGKLWFSIMTFQNNPQPIFPTVNKDVVLGGMSRKEYKKSLKRIDELVKEGPEENTLGWHELQTLGDKVIRYEKVYYPIEIPEAVKITRVLKGIIIEKGNPGITALKDPLNLVGHIENLTVDKGCLKADLHFNDCPHDMESFGILFPAIGGRVVERDGNKINKFELTEVSLTSNPNADPSIRPLRVQLFERMSDTDKDL